MRQIYSKSLVNEEVQYWNNRFLNLKEIVRQEKIGNTKFNNLIDVCDENGIPTCRSVRC